MQVIRQGICKEMFSWVRWLKKHVLLPFISAPQNSSAIRGKFLKSSTTSWWFARQARKRETACRIGGRSQGKEPDGRRRPAGAGGAMHTEVFLAWSLQLPWRQALLPASTAARPAACCTAGQLVPPSHHLLPLQGDAHLALRTPVLAHGK